MTLHTLPPAIDLYSFFSRVGGITVHGSVEWASFVTRSSILNMHVYVFLVLTIIHPISHLQWHLQEKHHSLYHTPRLFEISVIIYARIHKINSSAHFLHVFWYAPLPSCSDSYQVTHSTMCTHLLTRKKCQYFQAHDHFIIEIRFITSFSWCYNVNLQQYIVIEFSGLHVGVANEKTIYEQLIN